MSRASYICDGGAENRYAEGGRDYKKIVTRRTTHLGARPGIAPTRAGIVNWISGELFPIRDI